VIEASKPLVLVASGPDQRRPFKVRPLLGGACRANLDRPSLPRLGLSKQERLIGSGSARMPMQERTTDMIHWITFLYD
jgi:hypothetical protein